MQHNNNKLWYLLYCKRHEQLRAKQHLENQGVRCFYPEIQFEKMVRGNAKTVVEPLFPSYVFIQVDLLAGPSVTTIRSTRGVCDFIRFGSEPKPLPNELVEHLMQINEEQERKTISLLPKKGEIVEILHGQFSGIPAIYQEPDGETRSMMLITLLNQPVKISIDNKQLRLGKGREG